MPLARLSARSRMRSARCAVRSSRMSAGTMAACQNSWPVTINIVEIMATLTAKGDWFRNIAAMDHQRIEWRQVLDYPADALAREARGADLVVIGQTKGPGDALGSLDPGEALLKIGRPTRRP